MENTEIILAVIGVQTTILLFILRYVIHKVDKLADRIDNLQYQINVLHTDLQVVKSILHMKDCCMLNNKSSEKAS